MARVKKPDAAAPGAPLWMVTYSDMITQILAFFIMLFSFSSVNEHKFGQALASLQGSFGILNASTAIVPAPFQSPGTGGASPGQQPTVPISVLEKELKSALEEQKADQFVRIEQRDGTLVLHFDAAILFDSGKAEVKKEAFPALEAIGDVLKGAGNHIRIEGHTDSDPMIPNPQFPDNWALSMGRAAVVLRHLRDFYGIPENRFSGSGYSDTRPVAPNNTPESKAKNRRVDIVVLGTR